MDAGFRGLQMRIFGDYRYGFLVDYGCGILAATETGLHNASANLMNTGARLSVLFLYRKF